MMGDKANTKHGNMVALPNFGLTIVAPAEASSYSIWPTPSSLDPKTAIGMPFDGAVLAYVHSGDYAGAGTWKTYITVNDTRVTSTQLSITQAINRWIAGSPQAIQFSAGDTLGVSATTDAEYTSNDNGEAFATIYVMFSNT